LTRRVKSLPRRLTGPAHFCDHGFMLDGLRVALYRALTTPAGDGFAPIRVQKDLGRRLNTVLGKPLCDAPELERRRAAAARLEALRSAKAPSPATKAKPIAAPVMIYFEKNRNQRELERVRELLDARAIAYQMLDVTGDEAAMAFVTQKANCKEDDLPIVFVAAEVIGPFPRLVEADVSGALLAKVYPKAS
jgi:hypothetical protein